jgi:hypothetical protein
MMDIIFIYRFSNLLELWKFFLLTLVCGLYVGISLNQFNYCHFVFILTMQVLMFHVNMIIAIFSTLETYSMMVYR